MEPISNADRLVLLLRQRLEERDKASAGASASAKTKSPTGAPAQTSAIRALAALDWQDERPFRRAIVQGLLAEELGADLINDAQFQQIVSRVSEAIEQEPQALALINAVAQELRRA